MVRSLEPGLLAFLMAVRSFERGGGRAVRMLDRVHASRSRPRAPSLGFGPFQAVLGIADLVFELANVRPLRGAIAGYAYGHPLPETLNDGLQLLPRKGQHAQGAALFLMLLQQPLHLALGFLLSLSTSAPILRGTGTRMPKQ